MGQLIASILNCTEDAYLGHPSSIIIIIINDDENWHHAAYKHNAGVHIEDYPATHSDIVSNTHEMIKCECQWQIIKLFLWLSF